MANFLLENLCLNVCFCPFCGHFALQTAMNKNRLFIVDSPLFIGGV